MRKAILIWLAVVAMASADPWAARLGEWVALQQRRAVVVDPIWESLSAYYPLSGNANDETEYGNDGALGSGASTTNAVPFAAAISSIRLNDTANSIVNLGIGWRPNNAPNWSGTSFSFSLWFFLISRKDFGGILSNNSSLEFGILQDNDAATSRSVTTWYSTVQNVFAPKILLPTAEWMHVVLTAEKSGSNAILRVYRNGVQERDPTIVDVGTRTLFMGTLDSIFFRLGQDRTSTTRRTNGYFTEAAFWGRTLSSNEVYRLYNEQLIYRKP